MAEKQQNTIAKVLLSLLLFPLIVFLIKGLTEKPAAIKHRLRITHKRVILFLLMFAILISLIAGILITLWYTFAAKSDEKIEAPPYVSTATFHNQGVC